MIEFEAGGAHHYSYIKKILLAAILVLIILVIVYFTHNKYTYQKEEAYNYTARDIGYIVADANKDSNGDGIENWKSNLLGADPSSIISNPNLIYASSTTKKDVGLTDEVAINVYAAANELRSKGDTSIPTTNAVGAAIAANALDKNKVIKIDESKIIINNDNSKVALRAYGNNLMSAIITYYPKVHEGGVLQAYYKTNDVNVLKDLQSNIDMLDLMLNQIYKIKVPSDAYNIHREILTRIVGAKAVEQSLMHTDKDALSAMIALQELKGFDKITANTLSDLKSFFDQKGIYFISNEPAFIINK